MKIDRKFLFSLGIALLFLNGCSFPISSPSKEIPSPPGIITVPSNTTPSNKNTLSPPDEKIPVIFVHGGGPCDIGALVFLTKHPQVNLLGMVLTYGEIHPVNALDDWPVFLYEILDYDRAALGLGSESPVDPLGHEFPTEWRDLADDFWGLALPSSQNEYQTAVGHELIIDLVNNSPEKVSILAMGAQTDIALAIQEDPGIIDNISHIVIMGGAFTMPGNLFEGPEKTNNKVAEWNMYVDPLAANIVFNSGVPLSIVPLDGIQYLVQRDDVDLINTINDPGVNFVAQMWNQQYEWFEEFLIWDTVTATVITNPENFYWTYDGVDVITDPGDFQGQTIALQNGAQHTRYATGADYEAIMQLIFDIFRSEKADTIPSDDGSEEVITSLAGTWEGNTGAFHITFIFKPECRLNEVCGTFEIPEFSVTGDITIVKVVGARLEFIATNISSGQPGNDYEYLELMEDGTLMYFTQGGDTINTAILYKQ